MLRRIYGYDINEIYAFFKFSSLRNKLSDLPSSFSSRQESYKVIPFCCLMYETLQMSFEGVI